MSRRVLRLLFCAALMGLLPVVDAIAAPRIGLLWWPADPSNPANPFVDTLQECLTGKLASACPESIFVAPESIRDSLFPLMEPATQPVSEEAFTALLARNDVQSRLVKRIDYLVTFTGGTAEEVKGGIACGGGFGAGGCLGFAWINKDTRIRVVIWDLQEPTLPSHQDTRIEGTTWIPAIILPIPLPARTEAEACEDMSRQILEFIRSSPPRKGLPLS